MKPSMFWVVLGVALVIMLAFGGVAPLSGQRDEPSVLTEDTSGKKPALPSGHPPHSMPVE